MLLSPAERRLGMAERPARLIPDRRDPTRITRIFAICCGPEDADDLDTLRTEMIVSALDMAVGQSKRRDVTHHPDQGCRYTSLTFGGRCKEAGVRPSIGSVGDPYDDAMAESVFPTLECELLSRRSFPSQSEARMACFAHIEGFCNPPTVHETRVDPGERMDRSAFGPKPEGIPRWCRPGIRALLD